VSGGAWAEGKCAEAVVDPDALMVTSVRGQVRGSHTADGICLAVPAPQRVRGTAGGRMEKSLLVSVVEDDGSFRESMSMLLSSFG
jgi:hypothetical protein